MVNLEFVGDEELVLGDTLAKAHLSKALRLTNVGIF